LKGGNFEAGTMLSATKSERTFLYLAEEKMIGRYRGEEELKEEEEGERQMYSRNEDR